MKAVPTPNTLDAMASIVASIPVLAYAAISEVLRNYPGVTAYAMVSMAYEMIRTAPRIRSARWHASSFGGEYKGSDVPLLTTEKAAAAAFCALQGMLVAPVHLVQDVKWMELRARGLDPLKYGYTEKDVRGENAYQSYWEIAANEPVRKQKKWNDSHLYTPRQD